MAVQTLYEVHTLKGGNWAVDSTYPDRDGAIEVAKSLHGEKQFQAVKVVKDTYDPATGQGKEIVVFDTTSKVNRDKPAPAAAPQAAAPTPPGAAAVLNPSPAQKRSQKGKNTKSDYAMAIKVSALLVLILAGGLGAIFLLHNAGGFFQKMF
ncbi:hypothetical protein NUH88_13025 [Nisaea acidiphila]|uniref:DUF2188 domain-containing protein n=1 Tax=Nisaea acidiphila TaxID=1862145 RepID=A0A9J7ALI2_9PROT|nr:hypothetical protein [Nisaea acidiphila]UUX48336.1 hypothetical protein NUH88_13025 [Nisaea acidiphila]